MLSPGFGSDIASQRLDDLDKSAIEHLLGIRARAAVLDLGCGFPIQSLRFALLGARVYAVDSHDFSAEAAEMASAARLDTLTFVQGDIQQVMAEWPNGGIDMIYSQRALHYLDPPDAAGLATRLFSNLAKGGKIFVSASGLNSELGQGYIGRDTPWGARYHPLSDEMRKKHDIEGRVCLYTEDDMSALFRAAGFATEKIYSSPFGNVKAVFSKPG